MKRYFALVLCVLLVAGMAGCTPPAQTEEPTPGSNELIADFDSIQEITVYVRDYTTEGTTITYREDGSIDTLPGFKVHTAIRDREQIQAILHMFDGWDKQANKVPGRLIMDWLCTTYVRFGDKVTLGVLGKVPDGCYGTIEETAHYLPEPFMDYILTLVEDEIN